MENRSRAPGKRSCSSTGKRRLAGEKQDFSQEQLADAVGVTRQTIGMIEAGKFNPSLQLCISICRALGKTLDDLFWEEESEDEKN